jgi:hypothetical protein
MISFFTSKEERKTLRHKRLVQWSTNRTKVLRGIKKRLYKKGEIDRARKSVHLKMTRKRKREKS